MSQALVHYYPLAGRLREVEGRKLVIDCNGDGVLFVEADADVQIAEIEAAAGGGHGLLMPPFPFVDQLIPDVQVSGSVVSGNVLSCPLVGIQVTRLLCGGFVVGHSFNHNVCDPMGVVHFMNAVADLAAGRRPAQPAVQPTWSRELLDARIPPSPAFQHREYDDTVTPPVRGDADDHVLRSFVFSSTDISALKEASSSLQPLATTTTFELLAAFLWRARTAALEIAPEEEVRLVTVVIFRRIATQLGLPSGYYGNTCVYPTVVMTAGALLGCTLGEVVRLVREAKAAVTAEYVRSTADHLVLRGRPCLCRKNHFVLTDVRRVGFDRVDFGWGEPAYGGPARAQPTVSLLVNVKGRNDAEDVVAIPISLPSTAMERFAVID
uniref:Uncharacterized protein n=1 Tax=Leersia perrieri TaxID=77586 RepID=A0A0D9V0P0_9ORYZ